MALDPKHRVADKDLVRLTPASMPGWAQICAVEILQAAVGTSKAVSTWWSAHEAAREILEKVLKTHNLCWARTGKFNRSYISTTVPISIEAKKSKLMTKKAATSFFRVDSGTI